MYIRFINGDNCWKLYQIVNARTCGAVQCQLKKTVLHILTAAFHSVNILEKREGGCHVFLLTVVCIDLHSELYFLLALPLNSLHPTTFLSSPFGVVHFYGNNRFTFPLAVFKVGFHQFFFIYLFYFFCVYICVCVCVCVWRGNSYLFIYLNPHPIHRILKCVCERTQLSKWNCY